jgi:hypothetical protein
MSVVTHSCRFRHYSCILAVESNVNYKPENLPFPPCKSSGYVFGINNPKAVSQSYLHHDEHADSTQRSMSLVSYWITSLTTHLKPSWDCVFFPTAVLVERSRTVATFLQDQHLMGDSTISFKNSPSDDCLSLVCDRNFGLTRNVLCHIGYSNQKNIAN